MIATRPDPEIPAKLLAWYDAHARALPWRALPGEPAPDPYRVWLSEIMLQQTTVAAVKPYFAAFTQRWPDVAALANAPEEDVMAAWAGLGYYSRARNLAKAARVVAEMGGFPDTEEGLRALPGVGDYTAAAIAAIRDDAVPKGDVLAAARIAGIMAAKQTGTLIPLCHPLSLDSVSVDSTVEDDGVRVTATASLTGKTGVEMEAMVACNIALLTIYDMCKALDRSMQVESLGLHEKSGGRSGDWRRTD